MLGGSAVEAAFMYAMAIVVARLLGKAEFGLFSLGLSAVGLNVIFYELGIPTAVMRYVAVYDGEHDPARAKGTAISGTVAAGTFGLIGGLVLAVLAEPVSRRIFGKPDLAPILPIMAIHLPTLGAAATLLRVTQARGTMRYRVLVEKFVLPLGRLFFVALFVGLGAGLVGAAWGSATACAVSLVVSVWLVARMARRAWGGAKPKWETWRVVAYAFPLMLASLAMYARTRGITLALGVVGSSEQLGLFSAAERTSVIAAMGLNAVGSIFAPISADLHNRDKATELHRILKTAAAWTVMAVLPVELLLIVCGREVMGTFGKGFVEGYLCLAILAGAQLVSCLFGSVNVLLAMCARQWLMLVDLVFFAIASMGLAAVLVPRMGVVGAAAAGAVGILGPRVTRVIEVAVLMRMTPFGIGHLKAMACVVPPVALLLAWRWLFPATTGKVLFLPVAVPTYLLLYVAALRLGARAEFDELVATLARRRGTGLGGPPAVGPDVDALMDDPAAPGPDEGGGGS